MPTRTSSRTSRRSPDVAGRAPRTTILVAVDGDRIVGSATLELDGRTSEDAGPLAPDEAHIRMLGVDPDARRAGVGKQLMAACETRARAAGRTRMTLHTTTLMRAAREMYTSLGYERSEDRVLSRRVRAARLHEGALTRGSA